MARAWGVHWLWGLLPVFPLYVVLADRTASRRVFLTLVVAGFAMQLFLFGRYSQGSWTF